MALDIDGVRPALFSRETLPVLRRLLGFRRFFRHAYAVEPAPWRLAELRQELTGATPRILAELEAFESFLTEAGGSRPAPQDRGS